MLQNRYKNRNFEYYVRLKNNLIFLWFVDMSLKLQNIIAFYERIILYWVRLHISGYLHFTAIQLEVLDWISTMHSDSDHCR